MWTDFARGWMTDAYWNGLYAAMMAACGAEERDAGIAREEKVPRARCTG